MEVVEFFLCLCMCSHTICICIFWEVVDETQVKHISPVNYPFTKYMDNKFVTYNIYATAHMCGMNAWPFSISRTIPLFDTFFSS